MTILTYIVIGLVILGVAMVGCWGWKLVGEVFSNVEEILEIEREGRE